MKIGIYGDSYCDSGQYNSHTWATKLAHLLGAEHVGYHALSGSPFYHCYQTVLKTADQYDRIIVTVTEPHRFPLRVEGRFVYNMGAAQGLSSQNRRNMFQWYSQVDPDYLHTVQALMLNDLERRYPSAVIIPAFSASFDSVRRSQFGSFSLMAVRARAMSSFGLDPDRPPEERTDSGRILCHLPWSWHTTLADLIYRSLSSTIDIDSAVWPELESADYYYNLRR